MRRTFGAALPANAFMLITAMDVTAIIGETRDHSPAFPSPFRYAFESFPHRRWTPSYHRKISAHQDREARTELWDRIRGRAQICHKKERGPQTQPQGQGLGPKTVTANFIKRLLWDQNDGKKWGLSCTRVKSANGIKRARYGGVMRICWWGLNGSCGQKVSNDHLGPCFVCGGRIRRIMPTEMANEVELGTDRPSIEPSARQLATQEFATSRLR